MHQVPKDFSKEAVANTDYLSAVFNLFCQGLTAKQKFDSRDKIKYDNTINAKVMGHTTTTTPSNSVQRLAHLDWQGLTT